jgi:hypothetical protein
MNESVVYEAVRNGELSVDCRGRIWRLGARRGIKKGGSVFVPCKPRRAENQVGSGYLQIRFATGKKRFCVMAHRLVWFHFCGEIPQGMEINHKNGIKTDNYPENLEVVTSSENKLHSIHILGQHKRVLNQNGENNVNAKLTSYQVSEIKRRRALGERLKDIANDFNIAEQTVSKTCLGERRCYG